MTPIFPDIGAKRNKFVPVWGESAKIPVIPRNFAYFPGFWRKNCVLSI